MANGEMESGLGRAVLVTTVHRGVFFGYLLGEPSKERVVLRNARNVVRWSGTRGFLGLAASGPTDQCRIGPRVPELTLWDITSVTTCTPEAVQRMEAAPWL